MNDDTRSWAHTVAATAGSAADKARAVVPKTYDRAAQAATYVSESIRQYPVAGSAVGALLGYGLGFLLHRQWSSMDPARYSRGGDGRSWTGTASEIAHSAADRARSTAPETYDRAAQVKDYIGGSITQHVLADAVIVALLGCALVFLAKR